MPTEILAVEKNTHPGLAPSRKIPGVHFSPSDTSPWKSGGEIVGVHFSESVFNINHRGGHFNNQKMAEQEVVGIDFILK